MIQNVIANQCAHWFAISEMFGRGEGGICLHFHRRILRKRVAIHSWSTGPRLNCEGFSHGLKTCHRHVFLTAFQIRPPPRYKTNPHPCGWGFVLWRRRRDLNPRYPFGVYTISNRARSASYATSPNCVSDCRLAYNTTCKRICQ